MTGRISKIENNIQDRNSQAWFKLCEYVDKVVSNKEEEFSPLEAIGKEYFSQIYTLPETISKMKHVKKVWLYGSRLKRIPPEIGDMESLEFFDPYTSYDLHWFPFEITNCKKLKDSRVSTRALYGNYKYRMGFPNLTANPVRYSGEMVKCSVCRKEMSYSDTNQLWISLSVGTDVLPLLINSCSIECENSLPTPATDYVQYPHKGSSRLKQPPDQNERLKQELKKRDDTESEQSINNIPEENSSSEKKLSLLKLVRKIWDK